MSLMITNQLVGVTHNTVRLVSVCMYAHTNYTLVSLGGWLPVLGANDGETHLTLLVNVRMVDPGLECDLHTHKQTPISSHKHEELHSDNIYWDRFGGGGGGGALNFIGPFNKVLNPATPSCSHQPLLIHRLQVNHHRDEERLCVCESEVSCGVGFYSKCTHEIS